MPPAWPAELAFADGPAWTVSPPIRPGLYAEVADADGDIEERTWLAFLIALLGPTEGEDPFAAIAAARTSWAAGEPPAVDGAQAGPRGAYEAGVAASNGDGLPGLGGPLGLAAGSVRG